MDRQAHPAMVNGVERYVQQITTWMYITIALAFGQENGMGWVCCSLLKRGCYHSHYSSEVLSTGLGRSVITSRSCRYCGLSAAGTRLSDLADGFRASSLISHAISSVVLCFSPSRVAIHTLHLCNTVGRLE
jgi:hypothetical protein